MSKHHKEKNQNSPDLAETNRGSEIVASPGFGLGLGIGLLIGAVASSLLMTKAGTELVAYIESKTSDLKDKATGLIESSELKDMAVDLLKGKAAETLLSVKDRASETIGNALGAAAEKLTSVAQTSVEAVGMGEDTNRPEMAGAGAKNKGGNGKGKA